MTPTDGTGPNVWRFLGVLSKTAYLEVREPLGCRNMRSDIISLMQRVVKGNSVLGFGGKFLNKSRTELRARFRRGIFRFLASAPLQSYGSGARQALEKRSNHEVSCGKSELRF